MIPRERAIRSYWVTAIDPILNEVLTGSYKRRRHISTHYVDSRISGLSNRNMTECVNNTIEVQNMVCSDEFLSELKNCKPVE
jgi:outer membrane receptor for Fe3+-dicitrate